MNTGDKHSSLLREVWQRWFREGASIFFSVIFEKSDFAFA